MRQKIGLILLTCSLGTGSALAQSEEAADTESGLLSFDPASIWDHRDGGDSAAEWDGDRFALQLDIGFEFITPINIDFRNTTTRQSYLNRFSLYGDDTYSDDTMSGISTFFTDAAIPDCIHGPFGAEDDFTAAGLRLDLALMGELGEWKTSEESALRFGPVLTLGLSFGGGESGQHQTFYASETVWNNGAQDTYIEQYGYADSELDIVMPRVLLGVRGEFESKLSNGSWFTIGAQAGIGGAFPHGDLDVHGSVYRQGQDLDRYRAFDYNDSDSGFEALGVAEATLRIGYHKENFSVTAFGGAEFWLGDASWQTTDVSATAFGSGDASFVGGIQLGWTF